MLTLDNHPALESIKIDIDARMKEELADIEEYVSGYTLADAIRDGSQHTDKMSGGFYNQSEACALSAAALAIKAQGK